MSQPVLLDILDRVRLLSADEVRELRDALDVGQAPSGPVDAEHAFEQEMLREGVLSEIPSPASNGVPLRHRKLAVVSGRPVSETLVEERR